MELSGKERLEFVLHALIGSVVDIDEKRLPVAAQGIVVDSESMIL